MKKTLLLIVSYVILSGCASIIKGETKSINIMTSNGDEVKADIISASGIQHITIPSTITIKRDNQIITINVKENNCYRHSSMMVSDKIEPWALLNLGFTYSASIGTTTDALTGALWTYDDNIIVPIYKKKECK